MSDVSTKTDEEVICEWMEPKPEDLNPHVGLLVSKGEWWYRYTLDKTWTACKPNLDRLHEVEARLTDEQWERYLDQLVDDDAISGYQTERDICHATAAQKIAALAAVIRGDAK